VLDHRFVDTGFVLNGLDHLALRIVREPLYTLNDALLP
jgi:hypothetical protein